MLETTMYTDHVGSGSQLKKMKSSMTLDFNSTKTKQQKLSSMLLSPELGLLKLASPELERMIIQSNGLVTTTPTPTQFLFPKSVTEEQEAYARGFVDALAELHGSQSQMSEDSSESTVTDDSLPAKPAPAPSTYATLTTVTVPNVSARTHAQSIFTTSNSLPTSTLPVQVSMSAGAMNRPGQSMTSLINRTQPSMVLPSSTLSSSMTVKQEDSQIVPCLGNTPPMSPINMESQERIKLERKRARNRVAARKCRTRKLERISRLEDKVADLKGHNNDLSQTATSLREQVVKLKEQIMEHVNSGCQVMLSPNLK